MKKTKNGMTKNKLDKARQVINQEDLLNSILLKSTIDCAVVITDLNHTIMAWNEGAHQLYGYQQSDVIGKKIFQFFSPDNVKSGQMQLILDKVHKEGSWAGELNHLRKNGQSFMAYTSYTLLYDAKGKIVGLTMIAIDMTEQKSLEMKIKQQNQDLIDTTNFLNNILESSTEYSIVATDLNGLILAWNVGARNNYGYTPEEIIHQVTIKFLHTHHDIQSGKVDHFLETVRKNGKAEGTFERIRKNGEHFTASVVMSLRRNSIGEPIGYLLISKDITEQIRLQEQLRKNKELEEQNKRVQEANRLKSQFLANMSHELRTPLNGIIGFAELMYNGKVGPVSDIHKEYLGDILSSSHHLLQLINDVLDLAKVESGKVEFHPESVDLGVLIHDVQNVLRTLIVKKRIELTTTIHPQIQHVVIDPSKFKQILYNYISNAIKFTPENGKIKIRINPEGEKQFRLEVEDNGIGIHAEDQEKLFIEFQQLNDDISKKYIGTGLGLALTRRIAEAQGGRVGVSSQFGKGSIFYAILPCMPPYLEHLEKTKTQQIETAKNSNQLSVLIIEDEPNDQAVLVSALTQVGFNVDVASTGREALEKANRHHYDAITLDLILPDMTGWDVLHHLRANGLNQKTPTIVVTVVPGKTASFGFMVNDYLTKPINTNELVIALERVGVSQNDKTKTVLIIDQDKEALKKVKNALPVNDYRVICKSDSDSALQSANTDHPDVIMLDLLMPETTSFDFLCRLRSTQLGLNIPVILYTTKTLNENDMEKLKSEADEVAKRRHANLNNSLLIQLMHYLPEKSSGVKAHLVKNKNK